MIIFSLDVRNRICKKERRFMDAVDLQTQIKLLKDDEEEKNEVILSKLDDMAKLASEILEIRKEELRKEIHEFEEEFIADILKYPSAYENNKL